MPRRRRTKRANTRQTGHPYAEVIVFDDEVPTPPPPTPLIVIDDDDDNTVPAEVPVEASAIEVPVETPAVEVPVETPAAEVPVEIPIEAPVEIPAETPAENPAECVICQEGGTLVDSNCHECHVKVHQNCLDNWLFPRLNEPTCPHCRTVMVLSSLEIDGIRQRKRAGMTEAVSNT